MITDFPTAPLAPGLRGAGGSTVEKSLSASHTEILTLPGGGVSKFVFSSTASTLLSRYPSLMPIRNLNGQ